ncbi:unnamed protein product [Calicophoron daubneyi]|uniref:Ig-like domain-containing protein n=1 Tax=Calicophoron daubneyi TaxID=300641 RepID=A0AAV2TL38_CALDB
MFTWILWLLPLVTTVTSLSTECQINNTSNLRLTLTLDLSDVSIDERLGTLCPTATSITVGESTEGPTRKLSSHALSVDYFPCLYEFRVAVSHLVLESGAYHPGRKSAVRSISLSGCKISSLPALGFLYGFSELQHFDLSNNMLHSVPPDLLFYSPNFVSLDLSRNLFSTLPSLRMTNQSLTQSIKTVNMTGNIISCSCLNSWLLTVTNYFGVSGCEKWPAPCAPYLSVEPHLPNLKFNNTPLSVDVLASQDITFSCSVSSSSPAGVFWLSPVGVLPGSVSSSNSSVSYTYYFQPLLTSTTLRITTISPYTSEMEIKNVRGHLAGDWYCIGRSDTELKISLPITVNVHSSMYSAHVYLISLCYGFGTMGILLLIGIFGGTIRYCSETHCLRRPQPPFAYAGKTIIGVIPVPEVDGECGDDKSFAHEVGETPDGSSRYIAAGRICKICGKPPTHWFCDGCKTVHFAEAVKDLEQDMLGLNDELLVGDLASDGEIRIRCFNSSNAKDICQPVVSSHGGDETPEVQQPLMVGPVELLSNENVHSDAPKSRCIIDSAVPPSALCVYSGNCVVVVRDKCSKELLPNDDRDVMNSICLHYAQRPNSADVKLVVSNDKLAEEYREALADLARAVESPDPAHFREHLEEFRSRLRRDVGHGVKILRGEFQGLRAKSAKGVASLRSQSSAAAQRMRAGISHGVEQVKDSMRSVAELCGASSTIGQTISVVSVYVDETDQTKKEKFISDFVF